MNSSKNFGRLLLVITLLVSLMGLWNVIEFNARNSLKEVLKIDKAEIINSTSSIKVNAGYIDLNSKSPVVEDSSQLGEVNRNLAQYSLISRKPFPSSAEKVFLSEELKNSKSIEETKIVLRDVPKMVGSADITAHLNATRFILAALEGINSQQAILVIEEVLRDPSVEDSNQDISTLRLIAGDRAELMYGLLQYDAKLLADINLALPGPTSRKILESVQKHRQVLMAEVESEVAQLTIEYNK